MTTRTDDGVLATLRGSPAPVRALIAGVFLNRLGRFFQFYLVLFLTTQGFTPAQAGLALGGYGAGTVLGVIIGGALADRLGARRCTLISMLGSAGFMLAVQYLTSFPALLVAVVLVGVVTQIFRPAAAALLAELTPTHRRVMIFSIYRMAFSIGNTSAPLIGAALLAVSYHLLFWTEALACAAFALVAVVALPRPVADPAPAPGRSGTGQGGYSAVLADRRFLLYLLGLFFNIVVYVQSTAILPLAMHDAHLATHWYGEMLALNGFIVMACGVLVTKVVQRRAATRVMAVGFLLLGGGQALYGLPWGAGIFVAGTVIWSLGEVVGGPTMLSYPSVAAPDGLRARYQGAAHATFGIAFAVGPFIGTALYGMLGPAMWGVSGLVSLLALTAAWFGMRPVPTPAPSTGTKPETAPESDRELISVSTSDSTE
jgi:MFS family permease